MSKYVRDEEYDEPEVSASERTMAEGWYIAAGMIYIGGLLVAFFVGWACGATS